MNSPARMYANISASKYSGFCVTTHSPDLSHTFSTCEYCSPLLCFDACGPEMECYLPSVRTITDTLARQGMAKSHFTSNKELTMVQAEVGEPLAHLVRVKLCQRLGTAPSGVLESLSLLVMGLH